jgi:hypothetical protein
MELNPCLPDGVLGYQVDVLFEEHIASPTWGDGRGVIAKVESKTRKLILRVLFFLELLNRLLFLHW